LKLSIKERLLLAGLLPAEGGITTIRTITETRSMLYLSADEVERWGVKQNGASVTWDADADTETDIPLSGLAKNMIADTLLKLDAEKKLTADHISLWEQFVEDTDEAKTST